MKKILTYITVLASMIFSCSEDKKIADPIFEFASFAGSDAVSLGEATNSADGYPLVVQLWASNPYQEDVTITLDVTGTNTAKNVDFTVADNIKIKAGKFFSDTVWVKTVDNGVGNELERTFEVKINAISKSDIKLGLGITNPKNKKIVFKIQDDECSGNPICVFNTGLTNTISYTGGGATKSATSAVDKINSKVTVSGNMIDYGKFSEATLTLTLTPSAPSSTTGTVLFGEQPTGTDSDGYDYKFIQVGTGAYNAVAKTISIEYDIYYQAGGWVYWYSVTNVLSAP